MKQLLLLSSLVCMFFLVSCKSSESPYKKAYEKAKQQELAQTQEQQVTVEVVPVVTETPVTPIPVVSNEGVRQEKVTVASGSQDSLKDYSVICGSFGLKANAEGLKDFLVSEGYNPVILYNQENQMYRVAVATFADKAEAIQARNQFKARFPNRKDFQDSWILYRL